MRGTHIRRCRPGGSGCPGDGLNARRACRAHRLSGRATGGLGRVPRGGMHELVALGAAPLEGGARIAVTSEVPVAAGLASAAPLTVAPAPALRPLGGPPLPA